ncbi:hypothetical protein A1O1_04029 [Capronia coronata CBS 617.96]|uniref:Endonuclease/exonuclease/phosphatase domain-containing protein n=1 Tax=Capronia coronata CBS 617.96 TaxID=1182541 RepID=W9YEI3_9EURO|nr:uncharacterized protein A1O1_04029 [Capronia coronata CBS 617.96]EXJ90923.1 hypothetical protein A1O1_04029 [Capronia coronata CBS 617.96]
MGDASSPPPVARQVSSQEAPGTSVVPLRIITHNIRFANTSPEKHERLWEDRFPHLSSHFKYHTRPHFAPQSTLVCMQEVLHRQLQDLVKHTFNTSGSTSPSHAEESDWTFVGVGRNDGKTKGEYSPIFFRKSAWKLRHFETVWLNETGEVGKKGWDASSIRILTCAVLQSALPPTDSGVTSTSHTSRVILALNTHLDDQGVVSRRESTKLILKVASRLKSQYSPQFTFLAGDLNSRPDDDAYQLLNMPGSSFVDTRRLIPDDNNAEGKIYAYGNERTFTGFAGDAGAGGRHRIDFIHLGISEGTHDEAEIDTLKQMVQGYGVLPSRFDDQIWMSDHRGIVVDLLVPMKSP